MTAITDGVERPVGQSPLPHWNLDALYDDLDGRSFRADLEGVLSGIDRLVAHYDEAGIAADAPVLEPAEAATRAAAVLAATNELHGALRPVAAYLHARLTTAAGDDAAAAANSQLQTRLSRLNALSARWDGWVHRQGADGLADHDPVAAEHRFSLRRAERSAPYRMGPGEESLAAELRPSGSGAWATLHRDVTSRLTVRRPDPHRGAEHGREPDPDDRDVIPMSAARALASDADPAVRSAAFRAEVEAWRSVEVPLAAALNGAFGERVVLNRRRGWPDDLDAALFTNNVDRATLDAMHEAIDGSLDAFRRYFRAKAALLDPGADALPWWDLFAPVRSVAPAGATEPVIEWDDAVAMVRDAFGRYDSTLVSLADRAVGQGWIDAEPRAGKVDGAFCLPVGPGVSRVLLNYDGSTKGVSTLAHELGHAFHGVQLAERTPVQRATPMALAETASIFCETLLVQHLLAELETRDADPAAGWARLAVLDAELQNAGQVVVDIRSRFLFEQRLCRRRAERVLAPSELCSMMLDAQEQSYGDGVRSDARHPYMWAVKGHYFTPFYNWPYAFGLLFGLGLFRAYQDDPVRFRTGYHDLLSRTGMDDARGLAAGFAIDVADVGFWRSSLDVLEQRIDEFVALAARLR